MRVDPGDPAGTIGAIGATLTMLMPATHTRRLQSEAALSGLSADELVKQALAEYFARLDRQRDNGAT